MNYSPVVYLVDNKRRDLSGAALVAFQLERLGVPCVIEPLEAYRGILAVYKPSMVVINHLLATHLVQYSKRLKDLGILVGVLPNEGIYYGISDLMFNAGRAHNDAHIDVYFCWNRVHAKALVEVGFETEKIKIVGTPRSDFYFHPWNSYYDLPDNEFPNRRQKVLFCTNFTIAKYYDLPKFEADKLYESWQRNADRFKDYWGAIGVTYRNRERSLVFLKALLESNLFNVVLRIHPSEDPDRYLQFISTLSEREKSSLRLDRDSSISALILDCDIEVSMDSCQTALDSWVAKKPTISLDLEQHEMLSNKLLDYCHVKSANSDTFVDDICRELKNPLQPEYEASRQDHLETWLDCPQGKSAEKIAALILNMLTERYHARSARGDFAGRLTFSDVRRGAKLKLLRAFNLPYSWHPQLKLRELLDKKSVYIKKETLDKTISPNEAKLAKEKLLKLYQGPAL
jgi:surface carbohydrate biosynthesis protein